MGKARWRRFLRWRAGALSLGRRGKRPEGVVPHETGHMPRGRPTIWPFLILCDCARSVTTVSVSETTRSVKCVYMIERDWRGVFAL